MTGDCLERAESFDALWQLTGFFLGWTGAQGDATLKLLASLYEGRIDLSPLRG